MLSVKELIEELQRHPQHCRVQVSRDGIDIDEIKFEGNYVEIRITEEIPDEDGDGYSPAFEALREIEVTIGDIDFKTIKKSELEAALKEIQESIDKGLEQ